MGVYLNRPVTCVLLFARWCFLLLLGVVCLYGPVSSCALVELW